MFKIGEKITSLLQVVSSMQLY